MEFIEGEAVDISGQDQSKVLLADGRELNADKIILALGNQQPAELPGTENLRDHPAYCGNPWQTWNNKLPPNGSTVLLLGTGLTTVDAVLTLLESDWTGTIQAVSRNGLIPQSHFKGVEYSDFPPENPATLGLKKLSLSLIHI